ncbi:MAG: polyribonucleotide nucleotidyltransferase [Candidatus Parcubacteria bacterium]|nr:polyribonucleotide nucleotidyltransferase [Candidatus Parcubacteria bacterium]
METEKFTLKLGDRDLIIETRDLAEQANGSVLVRYGDTVVLGTAVMAKKAISGKDFFPLTVEYEERFYAAGKILGSRYMRREGRPSDEAIITARVIDRTIRPLFPKSFQREVQVVATCLSWDEANDPDLVGLIAASQSLAISDIPWSGPVAVVRIGKNGGDFILNPTYEQRLKNSLDFVFTAIRRNGKFLINMIEAESQELDEKVFSDALKFAKPYLEQILDFQIKIAEKLGKGKGEIGETPADPELEKEIKEFLGTRLEDALFKGDKKKDRMENVYALKDEAAEYIEGLYPGTSKSKYTKDYLEKEIDRIVHEKAINEGKRVDGRKLDELREINFETGLIPRTHGSGLFERGETNVLSLLTLGAPGDQRLLEGMEFVGKKRFFHHYNFPPYSSGEIKPMRGPGRREIGHGMLAEKALLSLIPTFEEFPYTVRIVSEVLSSNGSTSMASITSSSLALMDAGVPIKAPATGISIGLMQDGQGNYKLLTDIQGPEDHHGDMDFKVAGTKNGITAVQMDVKIDGITEEIFNEALVAAKKVRLHILEKMAKVIDKPRPQLSAYAPRILTIKINPEKIREVVGPGGKIINEIIDKCQVAIDIQPTGIIFVTAEKEENAKKAVSWIESITREVKVGEIFEGKVKRIMAFGAFVEILPGQEGMVHISQMANYHVEKVEDIVKLGDTVTVKVIEVDELGRINLSIKEATDKR